jgi:hypothetical protein
MDGRVSSWSHAYGVGKYTADFNHSEIDNRFTHTSQIRLLCSRITWRSEKHLRLIRISPWTFHFHETELFIQKVIHEFISRISAYPTFWRCKVFAYSPTPAPRGSGLTPMIWLHENFRILVKNVTLGTSEWTRVLRNTRNGHIEAVSLNYPPHPYK